MNIEKLYGNKIRVRVCGVCREADKTLLVKHKSLNASDTFWCPPGGGIETGETAQQALIREFAEETGLEIRIKGFLSVQEFIKNPLHAIELFFEVEIIGGLPKQGTDPEMKPENQIITEIRWFSDEEISALPAEEIHNYFSFAEKKI